MKIQNINSGDNLYWKDPDGDLCSGFFTVLRTIQSFGADDDMVILRNNNGSELEAYPHELHSKK
jgi:hypothetical protein